MHQIALDFISLPEPQIMGISYLVIIVGFVLGALLWKGTTPMRRVYYFLTVCFITFGATVSQLGWTIITDFTGSAISIMFVFSMVAYLIAGFASWMAAAARSQDISGDRSRAWMGIVPIANLVLVFKRGSRSLIPGKRSATSRFIGDPLIVIFGIFLIGTGNAFLDLQIAQQEKRFGVAGSAPADPAKLAEFLVTQLRPNLPQQLDEITVLKSIDSSGNTLIYGYEVDTDYDAFNDGFPDTLRSRMCGPDGLRDVIQSGVDVRLIYERKSDRYQILNLPITAADCRTSTG